jgi:hypothetical protein
MPPIRDDGQQRQETRQAIALRQMDSTLAGIPARQQDGRRRDDPTLIDDVAA